jgi:hypothetical protein
MARACFCLKKVYISREEFPKKSTDSKHDTSPRPRRKVGEQLWVLVAPMAQRKHRTRRDETLTSFLRRICGQKNAISTGSKAGSGSQELDKVGVP